MIPPIHDDSFVRFWPRMAVALLHNARSSFALASLFFLVSTASAGSPMPSSQDSSAKPAPAPSTQQSPAAPAKPSASAPTPLQKAVHQRKVLTDEDLAKPPKVISLDDLEGEENNPLCDLSCEAELRAQFGFG